MVLSSQSHSSTVLDQPRKQTTRQLGALGSLSTTSDAHGSGSYEHHEKGARARKHTHEKTKTNKKKKKLKTITTPVQKVWSSMQCAWGGGGGGGGVK